MKNPFDNVPDVDTDKLVCSEGDILVVIKSDEGLHLNDLYMVHSRIYYGWNLKLTSGSGASEIRVLNSELLRFFKLTGETKTKQA